MAEKIYPASKPPPTTAPPPSFPPNKPLARPVYRPNPNRNRNRRSCCCSICLFLTVTIAILIFLLAITAAVSYVIYRPHRPSFSVSSLHVTSFNMTSSSKLNARFNLTLTARNPNKRIVYVMDQGDVTFGYRKTKLGEGKVNAFTMSRKNTTTLRSVVTSSGEMVNDSDLKSELKAKKSVELRIEIGTKIRAKIGSVKTKKVPIRITCDGVKAGASGATVSGAKCEVDLRIKIWKWTI
ncbi:NDR1/HIN1-like protein 13 [Tanacetum coccineum]